MTDDEDYNDAAYFLIEVHDDLEEPKEQLGIEMERVSSYNQSPVAKIMKK